MEHLSWLYLHIVLFVFWLGGDVGVYLAMAFIKNPALSFETRATIIRLAFYVDLFPRCAFALMLPVGAQLAGHLGLLPVGGALQAFAWVLGLGWCALHLSTLFLKGTPLARRLRQVNIGFEALMGLRFVGLGAAILLGAGPPWLHPPDSAERERVITRMTNQTMAWALLLYALILAIAFLGKVKPL